MKANQFPDFIFKEVANLYLKLNQFFNIKAPEIKGTAIYYFYKYYQKLHSNPPEYAIAAISCFHLATKVYDISIAFTQYIYVIKNSPKSGITSSFIKSFKVLDGIPPSSAPDFYVILLKKLVKKEMEIIIDLDFDFTAKIPYDISTMMIDQILKWHISPKDHIFLPLRDELNRRCWSFFNDLQISEIFYTNDPEMIAISSIELAFLLVDLPLVSPKNSPWYTFLVPNVNLDKINELTLEMKKKLYLYFHNLNGKNNYFKLKMQIDKNILTDWIRFPLIPLKKYPFCDPPSFDLLDSIKSHNKKDEIDYYAPKFPPPDFLISNESNSFVSPSLAQMQKEYSIYLKK